MMPATTENGIAWENVYETESYREGPSHKKLRRNKIDGVFGGVCSGFGDYFGIDHTIMRILFVLSVIFLGLPFFIYFILWIFVPKDTRAPYRREYREARRARRKHRENPEEPLVRTTSFKDVKSKFRSLGNTDARLRAQYHKQRMETSPRLSGPRKLGPKHTQLDHQRRET